MRLFGRGKKEASVEKDVSVGEPAECRHTALTAHWNALDDMGSPEKVSSYVCDACEGTFSRAEGERLMAEAAERLRVA